jgi:hypothetical protein
VLRTKHTCGLRQVNCRIMEFLPTPSVAAMRLTGEYH